MAIKSTSQLPMLYLGLIAIVRYLVHLFSPKYTVLRGNIDLTTKYRNEGIFSFVRNVYLFDEIRNKDTLCEVLFIKSKIDEDVFMNASSLNGYFLVRKRFFLHFIFAFVSEDGKLYSHKKDRMVLYSGMQKCVISAIFFIPVIAIIYLGSDGAYIRSDISKDTFYLGMSAVCILILFWIDKVSKMRDSIYFKEGKLINSVLLKNDRSEKNIL